MSELTFEQMLEESLKTIHAGEVVEGTAVSYTHLDVYKRQRLSKR